MAFKKSGVVPIEKVLCKCGGTIDKKSKTCGKCKKEFKKEK